jgi:hypothetical protein
MSRAFFVWGIALTCLGGLTAPASADDFSAYQLDRSFGLPSGVSSFDVLGDGRVVAMVNAEVMVETAVGAGTFASAGVLAGADVSPGSYATAFVRVSPDGTRFAVGNNGGSSFGNPRVGIFSASTLVGDWFPASHYDAAWIDNQHLALTAGVFGNPGVVTALDTSSTPSSPTNVTLVDNIGGASSGIAFDDAGNLYTANGFDGAGASDTGWVKAISAATWQSALSGGTAADFELDGTLIVDALSGGALGFDADDNLHIGGSDLFGSGQGNFGALVRNTSVAGALGGNVADVQNPSDVRQFDPDTANAFNVYDVNFNDVTGELYFREGETVYSYVVPEPASLLLLAMGAGFTTLRRRNEQRMWA